MVARPDITYVLSLELEYGYNIIRHWQELAGGQQGSGVDGSTAATCLRSRFVGDPDSADAPSPLSSRKPQSRCVTSSALMAHCEAG